MPIDRFLAVLEQHLIATRQPAEGSGYETIADMLTAPPLSSDPVLVAMVESGAAVDLADADAMRRHQTAVAAETDPQKRRALQEQFIVERRARLQLGGT